MLYKPGYRKKILFVLLLLVTALIVIYSVFALFFTNQLKTENKTLYSEYSKFLTNALEKDNLERHELFLKTIAEYGVSIIEDPKDDVLSSQVELGEFLTEFYKDKLLTDKGKSELIEKYFVPRQNARQFINLHKHVFWGVDKLENKSSDALLFTLDSLKILKDSNSIFIKSVFLKTINNLCIAYPVKSIFSSKSDFKKLEELKPFTLKQKNQQGEVFINENGNLVLWSRFGSLTEPKFDFVIAAVLDLKMLMDKICTYAWKRNVDAAVLIDKQGNVVFYNHKKGITELDHLVSTGTCLYTPGRDKVAKKNKHVDMLRNNNSGFFYFTAKNKKFYAGFCNVKDLDWKLIFITSADDIKSIVDQVETDINNKNIVSISTLEKHALKIQIILLILIVAVFILFVIISFSLSSKLTKSLTILNKGVEKITGGELSYKIPEIKTGDEIEKLAGNFNRMVDSINQYIKDLAETIKAKQEIESDIKVAARIQKSMLPNTLDIPDNLNPLGFELASDLIPCKTVAGDFYDYFLIDNEHLFFAVGDVSGKGVHASLFMVSIMKFLKEYILNTNYQSLHDVFKHLNNTISRDNNLCMFATLFAGILNLNTGTVKYAIAGHDSPVIYKKNKNKTEGIREGSSIIGVFKDKVHFDEGTFTLFKDDLMVLYTDGITEAADKNNEQWGRKNLESFVLNNSELPPSDIIKNLKVELSSFTEKSISENDDVTILIIKRNT